MEPKAGGRWEGPEDQRQGCHLQCAPDLPGPCLLLVLGHETQACHMSVSWEHAWGPLMLLFILGSGTLRLREK